MSRACLGPDCNRRMRSRGPGHRLCRLCRETRDRPARDVLVYGSDSPYNPLYSGEPGKDYRDGQLHEP